MANETSEDIMNLLSTKQIHELESLDRVSGKENILIDNGKVTYKITTDALLGYFINRFVGNVDEDIDVTALNAASCIHIIKPGQDIPVAQRVKGHFYLKLSEQNIASLYEAILEDNSANSYFLRTSKNNVSGILFPDHFYNNDKFYKYLKICTFELDSNINKIFVSETFTLQTVNNVTDGYMHTRNNKIHVEALFNNGTVVDNTIILTAEDLSNNTHVKKSIINAYFVKNTSKYELWIDTQNVNTILIARDFSLSNDKYPEAINHITSGYKAVFVDNNTVTTKDVNNVIENIGTKLKQSVSSNYDLENRVTTIEKNILKADLDFKYNVVTFNSNVPTNTNENQLNALLIRTVDTSNPLFLIKNDDGTIKVSKDGYYCLSLKQGYNILQGDNTILEMNVYVNDAKLVDLSTQVTLSKELKHTYSTGSVTLRLTTSDKIKVTTKWSNCSIALDNNSALQVTKYLDCKEDLDFGILDSDMFPYVGQARVGTARLMLDFGNENGGSEINVNELPLVDVAAVDIAKLKNME